MQGAFRDRTEIISSFKSSNADDSVSSGNRTDKAEVGAADVKLSRINTDFVLKNESASTGACTSGVNDNAVRYIGGVLESCQNGAWSEADVGGGSGGAGLCTFGLEQRAGRWKFVDYTQNKSGKVISEPYPYPAAPYTSGTFLAYVPAWRHYSPLYSSFSSSGYFSGKIKKILLPKEGASVFVQKRKWTCGDEGHEKVGTSLNCAIDFDGNLSLIIKPFHFVPNLVNDGSCGGR